MMLSCALDSKPVQIFTMASAVYPEDPIEVGKRLRHVRHALGFPSPEKWLDWLNGEVDSEISKGRWLHWEAGTRELGAQDVGLICRATGFSADYIIHGDRTTLRADLREKLRAFPEEKIPPKRPSTHGKAKG